MAKNQTNNSTNRTSDSTQKTTNRTQQRSTSRTTNSTHPTNSKSRKRCGLPKPSPEGLRPQARVGAQPP